MSAAEETPPKVADERDELHGGIDPAQDQPAHTASTASDGEPANLPKPPVTDGYVPFKPRGKPKQPIKAIPPPKPR
ncbi:hypothetical protein HETIRDRAFT_107590 [Heterobasidion irregulare TC 32-1]|uniref:Uncharacterized protein n=1 Tax=Heterobasidion irregulare (strain TC 32-1) TaxID=747525 RepID=W4JYM1_HETIT|nr:uncharacterized protein HETIRDRAFT_107590 [Heterobasidion irregulare TC 32-1]ETW77961.1 hypothetical protein HETIRDRAFT_107590 [Heterobasidion irregulare TC 32-1]